ncbi:hypothetical protein HKX48_002540 [Thoreauomyces humboldtii]|nr:hypothetical protein HKX48_002540 [Thoreauomyces humboldtii]
MPGDKYSAEEDKLLGALFRKKMPVKDIVDVVQETFGTKRTVTGLQKHWSCLQEDPSTSQQQQQPAPTEGKKRKKPSQKKQKTEEGGGGLPSDMKVE